MEPDVDVWTQVNYPRKVNMTLIPEEIADAKKRPKKRV